MVRKMVSPAVTSVPRNATEKPASSEGTLKVVAPPDELAVSPFPAVTRSRPSVARTSCPLWLHAPFVAVQTAMGYESTGKAVIPDWATQPPPQATVMLWPTVRTPAELM